MATPSETVETYRVKRKARTASPEIAAATTKNGRPAARSVGVDFGATRFRIVVLP